MSTIKPYTIVADIFLEKSQIQNMEILIERVILKLA